MKRSSPQTAAASGPKERITLLTGRNASAPKERITLLTGRNASARDAFLLKRVRDWVDEEWTTFNLSEAEARAYSPSDLLAALSQIAVGDAEKHRVLILRGVERLRAHEAEALAAMLPRVPADARLMLVADCDRIGRDAKVPAKLLRAVETEGQAFDFPHLRPQEAPGYVSQRAAAMNLRLSGDVPRLLVARVGADQTALDRELEKLAVAAETDQPVTREIVEAVTAASAEHTIFELTDAVGERSPQKALSAMKALLASGETVFLLLPMLARQLRLVWQAKATMEKIEDAALKDPSGARLGDWQKQKLQRQARVFTWAALEEGMEALWEVDLALKGIEEGGDDPNALLETLLLRLCGVGGGRVRLVEPLH